MANTKKKNDIKKEISKKGSTTTRKASSTKKKTVTKKKLVAEDALKKEIDVTGEIALIEKTVNRKKNVESTGKIPVKKINSIKNEDQPEEKKELTKEEIAEQRKERNRKKYQNQQKKYQESSKSKTKKTVVIEDEITEKEKKIVEIKEEKIEKEETSEEDLVKKEIPISEEKEKKEERKEKRKTNRKADHFTQTLSNIKTKSVDKINTVKEKTTDRNIPIGKTKEEQKKRSKRFIKEAFIYAIVLTIIDIACIYIFDYFNFLKLFDVKYLNVIVTILIALIFNFFIAYMVDYFVTVVWIKSKRKEKAGEQNGDSGVNKEEHREDIKDKE